MQHRSDDVLELQERVRGVMRPESEQDLLAAVDVQAEKAGVVGQHLSTGRARGVPRRVPGGRVSIGWVEAGGH